MHKQLPAILKDWIKSTRANQRGGRKENPEEIDGVEIITTNLNLPMRLSYWPILTIFILSGCDQSRLFEENTDFENRIWLANDIKVIDFVVSDIDNVYNIYFNVRNTMNYPHYNLYISFQLKDSLNRILAEDLQNFNLFDPKTGAPNGKSGLGDIFDHQFPLLEDYSFEYPGEKRLELKQFMRYDSLPDIVSTGMRIEIAGME